MTGRTCRPHWEGGLLRKAVYNVSMPQKACWCLLKGIPTFVLNPKYFSEGCGKHLVNEEVIYSFLCLRTLLDITGRHFQSLPDVLFWLQHADTGVSCLSERLGTGTEIKSKMDESGTHSFFLVYKCCFLCFLR